MTEIPIPLVSGPQQASMNKLIEAITCISIQYAQLETSRDSLICLHYEQALILNGLVYEMFFPAEMHLAGIEIFDLVEKSNPPAIETIPEDERLGVLRAYFETVSKATHPLRRALDALQTLDVVRIIEGKQ